jgi:hypothetical protein
VVVGRKLQLKPGVAWKGMLGLRPVGVVVGKYKWHGQLIIAGGSFPHNRTAGQPAVAQKALPQMRQPPWIPLAGRQRRGRQHACGAPAAKK